ncbi:ATP-binding protein [Chloroflexus sp.]|uniref:ATP-binding protein n=1 Tax=Chloroflexus sp. TaxID=1904827 RepID=UPI00298F18CB|nr:ATP-binding protein [Chloroflexus sp.]MCS6888927.1 ATP-binding protein [Chloroflexus sp.]MDW8405527.1 ATP-binding protein [Chloroflexus sp.]
MVDIQLFPKDRVVGIFRGFQQGGLEFHADLVLPYRNDLQNIPMHGQFLLVQLETPDEAVLGRITSFSSEGKLSYGAGEEFNIRAVREDRPIPEELREQYLKYRVNIRVLGVLRRNGYGVTFVPSHRRLPHVGSKVAFPSDEVLRAIAGHSGRGAPIGHLAFGEYVYAAGSKMFAAQEWMQVIGPEILVRFPIESLVSRRSFIFARAGFGKSNLNKLLFSMLYTETPTVVKRGGRRVPVGTVLFDPDGEYFWPDDKGRPGLCDVPALEDKLVVFTERQNPSPFYQSFVAGGIKLDLRRLRPADVIAIALGYERQEQQNVRKLRGLPQDRWEALVNLIDANGNTASLEEICRLLDLDPQRQEVEAVAARSNMTAIVKMLHDKSSQLMDMLIHAIAEGKLCVIDVSQMRGGQALVLSGLIVRRIFDRNQQQFTEAEPKTVPTIAVVEEAQAVLNERAPASEPYIEWVKEGRKYDLGALLITQQPGSIPVEILSQGDNWFIFHLISETDLISLKRANAHFSEDLLSSLLNEPIPGQGVFWSSVSSTPYPISFRALSFERLYQMRDPDYNRAAGNTFAQTLRSLFAAAQQRALEIRIPEAMDTPADEEKIDAMAMLEQRAIEALRNDTELRRKLESPNGVPWYSVQQFLSEQLPDVLEDRRQFAYYLLPKAMDAVFGSRPAGWETFKHPETGKTWIRVNK